MFNSNLVAAVNAAMGSRFEPSKQSPSSPIQNQNDDSDSDSSKEDNSRLVSSLDVIYLASLFQNLEQERRNGEEFFPQFDKLLKEKSIPEKIKEIFKLQDLEKFIGEFRCALIRSIMLQGIMYLTEEHICFHAYFPREQDVVLKDGFLSKRGLYGLYERYFFSLQNDILVYYHDQLDKYCPLEIIDLKYAVKVDKDSNKNRFKVVTPKRTYHFQADSLTSMEEWVTQLQRSIVRANNDGDHVKIVIPIESIVDIDNKLTSSLQDTIRIKTIDQDENDDEYLFAFIVDSQILFEKLQGLWSQYKELNLTRSQSYERPMSPELTIAGLPINTINVFSGWNPFSINKRRKSADDASTTITRSVSKSLQSSSSTSDTMTEQRETQSSVKKNLSRRVNTLIQNPIKYISSVFNEDPEDETKERFREHFALPENEQLRAVFYGYYLRMIPLYGKFYVSDNYVCYRSRVPGQTIKIKLPISAIYYHEKQKSNILGYYGLEILTNSQQEMFFEFGFKDIRDRFVEWLERLMNADKRRIPSDGSGNTDESHSIIQNAFIKEQLSWKKMTENYPPGSPKASNFNDGVTVFAPKLDKPMHITCLTIGSRGDVQPYIALAKGLMKEGHKVRIATHGEYKDWIESHGIEFGYVGGNPAELMRICVENGMFTLGFFREGVTNFRSWLDDLLKTSWEACQGTDLIIESPSAMSGIHIAEALEIPYFRAFTMPWTKTREYPHAFAVPYHDLKAPYNYSSYVLIENAFWRGIAPQVNRWRKNTLNLRTTNMEKMDAGTVPFLYNFSSSIVPRPYDWSDWICITGYWFLDNPEVGWKAPNDLLEFLDYNRNNNKKIVYIGFGSIVVDDPKALTKTIVEAVTKSGVAAILSKGWSDRLQQGKTDNNEEEVYPSCIFPVKSVPHDWLFKQIDAVVHHGGAGTTAAGLRAGKPTIIKPFFGDQFFWGDRIETMGIGIHLRKLTIDKLSDCLIRVTTDEHMIKKAELVGNNIEKEDGVSNAIQAIYKYLDHAKQRIISQPAPMATLSAISIATFVNSHCCSNQLGQLLTLLFFRSQEINSESENENVFEENASIYNRTESEVDFSAENLQDVESDLTSTANFATISATTSATTSYESSWYDDYNKVKSFICSLCKTRYIATNSPGTLATHLHTKHKEKTKYVQATLDKFAPKPYSKQD
ncbi:6977_t:CDS:10 [Cetraspora pellucida]|uniref:sterol 3beta-glucosyltransferase n=1 Tax=Cetraspora pellucida TaxID=1433469 RepID=A0A9N9BD53_9GLOM|nr:6977_t:CDS:10 [Cetraspora pellucida]